MYGNLRVFGGVLIFEHNVMFPEPKIIISICLEKNLPVTQHHYHVLYDRWISHYAVPLNARKLNPKRHLEFQNIRQHTKANTEHEEYVT